MVPPCVVVSILGVVGYCVPFGWSGLFPALGRSAPGGPACPAGVPISREKWGERGRGPLSSVGGSVGTVAGWTLQRGFPADSGGGARLSLKKVGGKNTRGKPLDPGFYGPLAAARSFWGLCHIVPVVGLFRRPSSYPDLETFFHKMLFQHIFPGNASQIGLRISEETAPRTDPGQQSPKRASGNERPLTQGGRGSPRDSLRPGFL